MTSQKTLDSSRELSIDEKLAITELMGVCTRIVLSAWEDLQPLIDWWNRPDVRAMVAAYMAERDRDPAG